MATAVSKLQAKPSSAMSDLTFNRPIRVQPKRNYRIIVTVSRRAYFLMGNTFLLNFFFIILFYFLINLLLFSGKSSPIVYCHEKQYNFWGDELVRGLIVQS